jgi:hypothetical protein
MRPGLTVLVVIITLSAIAGSAPAASFANDKSVSQLNQSAGESQLSDRVSVSGQSNFRQLSEEGSGPILSMLGISPIEVNRSALQTRYVELGYGLSYSTELIDVRVQSNRLMNDIEAAPSTSERQQQLLAALSQTEQRAVSLRSRHRQRIKAYNDENITTKQFLASLGKIDAEARVLKNRTEQLEKMAESTEGFSISQSRFTSLKLELQALSGPVRERIKTVLTGGTQSDRFFVQTGPNSVVISVIADETYIREAYRGNLRTAGSATGISPAEATNVTDDVYPTITSLQQDNETTANSPLARISITHERGRLRALIDGESERVFSAVQYRPLSSTSTRRSTSALKDSLRLTAHPTYPGGPVRLDLQGNSSGAPVNAQLTVGPPNGQSTVVGQTGEDGFLWTIAPDGVYQVTAIDGNSVVLVSVNPSFPPLIYGSITKGDERSGSNSNQTQNMAVES